MAITTFTPGGNETNTNNTTAVTAVAAPSSGVIRMVNSVKVTNTDTANRHVTIRVNKGGSLYVVRRSTALAVAATLEARDIILDATDESVQVVLNGTVTTNQLNVVSSFVDKA